MKIKIQSINNIFNQKAELEKKENIQTADKNTNTTQKYATIPAGTLAAIYGVKPKVCPVKPTELSINDMIQYSNKNNVSIDKLQHELLRECVEMRENNQWGEELANKVKKAELLDKTINEYIQSGKYYINEFADYTSEIQNLLELNEEQEKNKNNVKDRICISADKFRECVLNESILGSEDFFKCETASSFFGLVLFTPSLEIAKDFLQTIRENPDAEVTIRRYENKRIKTINNRKEKTSVRYTYDKETNSLINIELRTPKFQFDFDDKGVVQNGVIIDAENRRHYLGKNEVSALNKLESLKDYIYEKHGVDLDKELEQKVFATGNTEQLHFLACAAELMKNLDEYVEKKAPCTLDLFTDFMQNTAKSGLFVGEQLAPYVRYIENNWSKIKDYPISTEP